MKKSLYIILGLCFSLFTSCSEKIMGYSVVLWNIPEYEIRSGEVLPIYIKSNITHVYVAQTHNGEKIEIPLWQMTEPVKKNKINSVQNRYIENANTYAKVKLDGLPCRAEPVNTAKQVYRLRQGEIIKILFKGKGQAPMSGKNALEGDWYKILTKDGTQGWCFSYNLNLYEADINGNQIGGEIIEVEESIDEVYQNITMNIWYPEIFKNMIETNNIDLSKIHQAYNFYIDTQNNKVNLNTSSIHKNWEYKGYQKTGDNDYSLDEIPLKIISRRKNYIVLRYTDETGKPQDLDFVTISENINDIVEAEKLRRSQEFLSIVNHGPVFSSSSYGKLTLNEDGSFKWTNFRLLVPTIIDSTAKNVGTVTTKYTVSKMLKDNYDGVITFNFNGTFEEVNFLYKLEENGLRFEDATSAKKKGNQIIERSSSPVIVYFKR